MADINSHLPTADESDGAPGSAAPANAIQVGGTDGTNLRTVSTDTAGKVNTNVNQVTSPWVTQDNADGTPGNPPPAVATQVAGSDGVDLRTMSVDGNGHLRVNLFSGAAASIGSTTVNGIVRLNTVLPSEGAAGSATPFDTIQVGGTDGTNLRAITTDTSGNQKIVGNVASLATDSGNPVKIGGVFNDSTLPSPVSGQRVDLQADYKGRLIPAPQSLNYFHPVSTTRVQAVTNSTSALSTSLTTNITATSSGNTIIVCACCNAGTLTITDSAGQVYSTATTIAGNVTQTSKIFYFPNTAAGVTSVTISSTSSTDLNIIVTEYFGTLTVAPLDKTSTNGQTAATSWTSNATTTTAQASELLIGSCMTTLHNNTSFTAGTGWGSVATVINARGPANLELFMEDQYSTAVGTFAATGTTNQSDDEYAAIATFKLTTPNTVVPVNTVTTIKGSQGTLANVTINTIGTGGATATFYDSASGTGTVIASLNLTGQVGSLEYGLHFTNGLTLKITSSTADFTVVYD